MDFNSFVCSRCSGLLREQGMTVKGITMTNWKDKDADQILTGGNQKEREELCGRWNGSEMAVTSESDENAVRAFIRAKYVDKMWAGGGGGGHSHRKTSSGGG